jgi:hypothetical protein
MFDHHHGISTFGQDSPGGDIGAFTALYKVVIGLSHRNPAPEGEN